MMVNGTGKVIVYDVSDLKGEGKGVPMFKQEPFIDSGKVNKK